MPCNDCGESTRDEYYMVKHELWPLNNPGRETEDGEFLCISCLENRLGRRLTPRDFLDAPINRMNRGNWYKTPRLCERIGLTYVPRGVDLGKFIIQRETNNGNDHKQA